MKFRSDFVTNSSSSSFIAVCKTADECSLKEVDDYINSLEDPNYFFLFLDSNVQFGWEHRKFNNIKDKLNWLILQGYYFVELQEAVDEIVYKYAHVKVDWDLLDQYIKENNAYIDHQSWIGENYDVEQFFRYGNIEQFLTNPNSVIITGNDNGDTEYNFLEQPYIANKNYITY